MKKANLEHQKTTGCLKKLFPLRFLLISQLPLSLEIPSWVIFNSPFCVDFENVQFVIFWLNLDRDIGKILQGGDFKS